MSGRRPISEQTRKRVEDAIAQLTYHPNAGAKALASSRTQVIGLVVPIGSDAGSGVRMMFAQELAVAARQQDYDLLLVTADEGEAGLRRLAGRRLCDAIIVLQIGTHDSRLTAVRELGIPVMLLGVPDDQAGLHCVDFDFEGAAAAFVNDVADRGHRHLAVLGWSPQLGRRDMNFVRRFERGVIATAQARGVSFSWQLGRPGGAARLVDSALAAAPVVPSFVCTEPWGASEVMAELANRGLRPGVDVDVLALCEDDFAEAQSVPLSGISPRRSEVCQLTMKRLFQLINEDVAPEVVVVPPLLVRRASSA
jgi:DNA-binding LacI/PurR family transcriptional regulator